MAPLTIPSRSRQLVPTCLGHFLAPTDTDLDSGNNCHRSFRLFPRTDNLNNSANEPVRITATTGSPSFGHRSPLAQLSMPKLSVNGLKLRSTALTACRYKTATIPRNLDKWYSRPFLQNLQPFIYNTWEFMRMLPALHLILSSPSLLHN
jgi:hypothetical protein